MDTSLVTGFGIHLKVSDIAKSRYFYEEHLKLRPSFAYGDTDFLGTIPRGVATAPEAYRGITYEIGDGSKLEIAEDHIGVKDKTVFNESIASPKVSAMINVKSLVPLLETGRFMPKHGASQYYWGTIEIVVRDPDGWVIVLIAPHSEAERTAVEEYIELKVITPGGS